MTAKRAIITTQSGPCDFSSCFSNMCRFLHEISQNYAVLTKTTPISQHSESCLLPSSPAGTNLESFDEPGRVRLQTSSA